MALMQQIEDGAFPVTDPRFATATGTIRPSDLSRWVAILGFAAAPHKRRERPYVVSGDKACSHAVSARRKRNVRYELQSMIGCDAGSAFHRPVMYPPASARK